MDLIEGIKTRKSIRAYRPDPVPRAVLNDVLSLAINSPSWANIQPWEFCVVGGESIRRLKDAISARILAEQTSPGEVPMPQLSEKYSERRRQNGRKIFQLLGIPRGDNQAALEHRAQMGRFFDAPNGIFVYADAPVQHYIMFDLGLFTQTLMLSAHAYGLGTCAEAALVRHPEQVRTVLDIPRDKALVIGLSIGYPDNNAPINTHKSTREPLENCCTWYDVE